MTLNVLLISQLMLYALVSLRFCPKLVVAFVSWRNSIGRETGNNLSVVLLKPAEGARVKREICYQSSSGL